MMTTETSSVPGHKDPLRVISIAWGDKYVDDFLNLCLPALLASGNLPVLAEHFSTEFVFVTEKRLFNRVSSHPAYKQAIRICPIRLISLDDLIHRADSYGMSITYAFFRGFEDLGPAMTDCYMVFVHADFILADGSYRGLLPYLLRGERLVYSPSYCVVSEEVTPILLAVKDDVNSIISVPPRRMADMVLRHRHLSVRAKTVNQQFFSVDHIEQYYWAVDERTLLVRQFPVALVAMKPERHLEELRSYWDYGVIADFCPGMKYAAIGDSDDYLMLELRERDNPKGKLKLGWPSTDDIAKGLLAVITDYTQALGRAQFTVHSHDLPPDIGVFHDKLDDFVGKVLANLPAMLPSHHDHLQWKIHYSRFHEARAAVLEQQAKSGLPAVLSKINVQLQNATPDNAPNEEVTAATEDGPSKVIEFGDDCASRLSPKAAERLEHLLHAMTRFVGQTNLVEKEYAVLAAVLDRRLVVPVFAEEFDVRMEAIRNLVNHVDQNVSAVHEIVREFLDLHLDRSRELVCDLVGMARTLQPQVVATPASRDFLGAEPTSAIHRLSYCIFGKPGKYRRWHWTYTSTLHALAMADEYLIKNEKDVILIHGGRSMFHIPDRVRSIEVVPFDASEMRAKLRQLLNGGRRFDCCLINSDTSKFGDLREIHDLVRPVLRPGGKIIGAFLNPRLTDFRHVDINFIDRAFPVCGPATIIYSGNWASVAAFRLRSGFSAFAKYLRLLNTIRLAFEVSGLTAAAPFALIASMLESSRSPDHAVHLPNKLTSVTVMINVG